jgi:hypothetical protein
MPDSDAGDFGWRVVLREPQDDMGILLVGGWVCSSDPENEFRMTFSWRVAVGRFRFVSN